MLKELLKKLDQASSEAAKSCLRLAHLDVLDETIVAGLSEAAETWRSSSDDLLGNVYNMLLSEEGLTPDAVSACEAATDEVVKTVSHFASVLRSANLTDTNDNAYHPFSPEVADVWEPDKGEEARQVYGTEDEAHPAVHFLNHRAGLHKRQRHRPVMPASKRPDSQSCWRLGWLPPYLERHTALAPAHPHFSATRKPETCYGPLWQPGWMSRR